MGESPPIGFVRRPNSGKVCPKAANLDRERDEAELNGSMDRGEGMP